MHDVWTRRSFVRMAGVAAPALSWQVQRKQDGKPKREEQEQEEEVTPTEDLMREHGVLNRILLIYEEADRRISAHQQFDLRVLSSAAGIIKRFIEDYHEKLEEDHLFPRFVKAGKLVELVTTLRAQHQAGRVLTGSILTITQKGTFRPVAQARDETERNQVLNAMRQFIRMYRPHEAREDTVLFPTLHQIVSKNEYDAMGEDFEKKEHQLFGKEGFEGMRDKVADLEKQIGIYDLAKFTPTAS